MYSSLDLPLKITQRQQLPHTGFPLARNCSPQATCHNNSFNTLHRFTSLVFDIVLSCNSWDAGKMLEEASLLRLDSQGLIHTKFRQHLTFGYAATYTDSQIFPSHLEMALTASAFSSPLALCLVQDHPCVSFCTDVLLRLFQCPFDFPPSLLSGPLPDKDEMQASLPAELGALLGLGSAVLCTVALSRNGCLREATRSMGVIVLNYPWKL